ncbi:unnamed protein product [Rhizophagus irregularis]|nr:unnamed protein product [Rhizophagus irregularis]
MRNFRYIYSIGKVRHVSPGNFRVNGVFEIRSHYNFTKFKYIIGQENLNPKNLKLTKKKPIGLNGLSYLPFL